MTAKPPNFTTAAWALVAPRNMLCVAKLARESARWGIGFATFDESSDMLPLKDDPRVYRAFPNEDGSQKVFFSPAAETAVDSSRVLLHPTWSTVNDSIDVQSLLHEVCHIVVWAATQKTPAQQTECGPELWLESETSRRLGLPGRKGSMGNFNPSLGDLRAANVTSRWQSWSSLSTVNRSKLLTRARKEALAAGLISNLGKPLYAQKVPAQVNDA